MTPRVLLAHSMLWPNIARLAIVFRRAGFAVDAVARANHPIHRMQSPHRTFKYRPTSAYNSLREAIESSRPDLIIPCDDRIVGHLHRLQKEVSADSDRTHSRWLAALIETSLGPPASHEVVASRRFLASLAKLPDVRVPQTDPIETFRQLREWTQRHGLPAVLKLDGSSGGRDVILIKDTSRIALSFLRIRLRKSWLRRLKSLLFNDDVEPFFSRRRFSLSRVSVQSYVAGKLANCAIACLRGEVLASIAVEVVRSRGPFGLATVVRQVEGKAMIDAARSIARHLQLSGLFGFDFVLDADTKQAYLIEINPRATQINHFAAYDGPDLPTALLCALSGQAAANPIVEGPRGEVALFPQEWQRDPNSDLLVSAFHDVPYEEPELLRFYGYKAEAPCAIAVTATKAKATV
jgi:ATP-grasp in the biosynthetic pathway with Ter operon